MKKVTWSVKIRGAVADAMGYYVEDEQITQALDNYAKMPIREVRKRFKKAWDIFEEQGGRGVELADEIDELRIVLAAREAM